MAVFGGDLRPDVLGQDGDLGHIGEQGWLRNGAVDAHGIGVERRRFYDVRRVARPVGDVVLDDVVVRPGDVGGGQRHAVLPLGVLADREGPGLAVGAGRPAGREPRRFVWRHVGGVQTHERVVVHVPDGERLRVRADERVEAVRAGRPAQPEDDLSAGRRRAGARSEGRRDTPSETGHEDHRRRQQDRSTPRHACAFHQCPPCSVGVGGHRPAASRPVFRRAPLLPGTRGDSIRIIAFDKTSPAPDPPPVTGPCASSFQACHPPQSAFMPGLPPSKASYMLAREGGRDEMWLWQLSRSAAKGGDVVPARLPCHRAASRSEP